MKWGFVYHYQVKSIFLISFNGGGFIFDGGVSSWSGYTKLPTLRWFRSFLSSRNTTNITRSRIFFFVFDDLIKVLRLYYDYRFEIKYFLI